LQQQIDLKIPLSYFIAEGEFFANKIFQPYDFA